MVTLPVDTPVTTPAALTVAVPAALLLQVPPPTVSDNVITDPLHTVAGPLMVPALVVVLTVTA
jgi:hypothetical protein